MTETMSRPLQSASSTRVDELHSSIDRLRDGVTDADRRLRQFVEAQPLTALFGAVVAGYIAARVFRRL